MFASAWIIYYKANFTLASASYYNRLLERYVKTDYRLKQIDDTLDQIYTNKEILYGQLHTSCHVDNADHNVVNCDQLVD